MSDRDWLAELESEALYSPDGWFVHRVLSVDPEHHRVVAEMDTTRLGLLVDAQRPLPGHALHVPAALAIQATGTLGQLYAVFVLGLRVTDGWVGFGTHIHEARWGKIGLIGPPVVMTATCTRKRRLMGTWFCDFTYRYEQEGEVVYTSRQTAAWRKP